jgi:hypothetical protein
MSSPDKVPDNTAGIGSDDVHPINLNCGGAVRAEKGGDAALRDAKTKAVQCGAFAEAFRGTSEENGGFGHTGGR